MTAAEDERAQRPWRISQAAYPAIVEGFSRHGHGVRKPPTRHTLSRYLEGYVRGFHEHLPFLHLPTFSPTEAPEELVLSMAAVGALYKFEHARGYELLTTARAAVDARLGTLVPEMMASTDVPAAALATPTMQALVALVAMSSWGSGRLVAGALELGTQLAMLLRLSRISEPEPETETDTSWRAWIAVEERRRTMMVGFALLNLQAVAFDTPPPIANREIGLNLPCAIDAWRAPTETRWRQSRERGISVSVSYKTSLTSLLAGQDVPEAADVSALGNYLLMHGLVQQILTERQAAIGHEDGPSLSDDVVESLSRALQAWQRCWGGGGESTLDPLSSHGPVAFNATALLRIAYIRLVADLGPHRSVMTRDPARLARSVARAPLPALRRSRHADVAAGQCVGVLSILVRAGIGYVSRTHSHTWSIIHSLSYIECACFLSLWLRDVADVVAERGAASLRRDERRLLALLTGLMAETEHDNEDAPWAAEGEEDLAVIRRLAPACVGVWARVLQGEHVFQMVDDVSQGLALAAKMLVEQLGEGLGRSE
ncbi:hypothetical protein F5X68DRAFT_138929 [Plectosphaerella plurivora]|uniref:Xylanolytic transcriptional activator regulatory domain-containing protein n=1 Tax=Plectosphaerella plurivora TaxID=936078 RepID=A0A9P8V738_9PEZI|nr:hypothetical protein F5X68DRAFT_138929 [Plectosphaerella plurivora]